ncbi:zinc ribbon domain protein [Bacillus phage 015DV004]|nr:zinc ribbon domain protein [Bacillus phage 015DV004]
MSKQPFNLEWICTCGAKNISVVDHLKYVKSHHIVSRCRRCNERKSVITRTEVMSEAEGKEWCFKRVEELRAAGKKIRTVMK